MLSSILSNTQTPHQPLLVLCDTPVIPAHPIVRDLVRRDLAEGTPVALVCVVDPAATYGVHEGANVRVFDCSEPYDGTTITRLEDWLTHTVEELGRGVQVYLDGLDVLLEDWDAAARGVRMVKGVLERLRGLKAPSRLVLRLPTYSPLLDHLITPSTSPTLTLLTLHPPQLIAHLATTYLVAPPASGALDSAGEPGGMRFWGVLGAADGVGSAGSAGKAAGAGGGRGKAEGVGYVFSGEELAGGGVVELCDWAGGAAVDGKGEDSRAGRGVVVQILVRKQQGGANKGMSRVLEGLMPAGGGLVACAWNEVDGLRDVGRTYVGGGDVESVQEHHPSQQHIPFNLSLTPAQHASRAQVPIPYAHEGDEPAPSPAAGQQGGIIFEPGSEDDMDEDDPDEDLDF